MKINENDVIVNEEENIYQKLAQATARAVDINLGKTTLADLLDGYTRYIQLKSILTELEEYLTKIIKNGADIEKLTCSNILVYLKELKERYK